MCVCLSRSLFVLLKGATKEQAFKIGNEIAEAVTATNPKPVKLKFEKVVHTHSHIHTQPQCALVDIYIDLFVCACVPRCTFPACCRQRSVMWATCMKAWTRRSLCLMPKGSRQCAATAALLFPR